MSDQDGYLFWWAKLLLLSPLWATLLYAAVGIWKSGRLFKRIEDELSNPASCKEKGR